MPSNNNNNMDIASDVDIKNDIYKKYEQWYVEVITDKNTDNNNYMNKSVVHNAYVKWYADIEYSALKEKAKPIIPDIIAKAMMEVSEKTATAGNFRNYSWIDEMIGLAIVRLVEQAEAYDITREDANPFALFSMIVKYKFIEVIHKEKKIYMSPKKYRINNYDINTLTSGDQQQAGQYQVEQHNTSENSNALTMELYINEVSEVAEFDKSEEEKKKKRKARLLELAKEKEDALKNVEGFSL